MQFDLQRSHAKHLRQNMTRAEVFLWVRLRNRSLNGHRFNRQVEIGPYIADFLCREKKLIVEVDGATHEDTKAYDARRTTFLTSKGFRIVRFLNQEIYGDIDDVLQRILSALQHRTR